MKERKKPEGKEEGKEEGKKGRSDGKTREINNQFVFVCRSEIRFSRCLSLGKKETVLIY